MRAGIAGWDLLKHSFYRRWTSGELSVAELQDYACQYGFVVAAMPRWQAQAAAADPGNRAILEVHAREESAHLELWADFAGAVGVRSRVLATAEPNRTRYFEVHRTMDVRHTVELEGIVAKTPASSQAAADAMSEALWSILTSVEAEVALA
jgi:pyrroloquinoline quinone (PQQ) biosynthesis protein C